MAVYAIEYETSDESTVPRFGHTAVSAPDANVALEKFRKDHPNADVTEMRRVHA